MKCARATFLLALAASFPATAAEAPFAEVNAWWLKAEDLMANKGQYRGIEQGVRRKLAEPLLLSAWQNRRPLAVPAKRQVGLRLVQAWLGANNLIKAWDFLAELRG